MKKLLTPFIVLFFMGLIFPQDSTKSIDTIINNNVKNIEIDRNCYQTGYKAGSKFSDDDAISFGLGMIVPIAPYVYLAAEFISPKPPQNLLEKHKLCDDIFIRGYQNGAKDTRKTYIIKGAITSLVIIIIGSGGDVLMN